MSYNLLKNKLTTINNFCGNVSSWVNATAFTVWCFNCFLQIMKTNQAVWIFNETNNMIDCPLLKTAVTLQHIFCHTIHPWHCSLGLHKSVPFLAGMKAALKWYMLSVFHPISWLQVVINFCKYIQWLCYKLLRLPLPLVYYWASWWSTSSAHSSWCSMLADYWYTCGMCQFLKWTLVVFCLYILFICQLCFTSLLN